MHINRKPKHLLPVIIFSQLAGTSLWFAGNAVMPELVSNHDIDPLYLGYAISSVQLGFIFATLLFAVFSLTDIFSPVKLFFISSVLGAFSNSAIVLFEVTPASILIFRFLTGVCLAGIYPVGMKISSDWYEKGLGKALGFLVGALVLGTAFPHLIRNFIGSLNWEFVLMTTSAFALFGGALLILTIKNGPFRTRSTGFRPSALGDLFKIKSFRNAAIGYFGHMWELYAFWTFVPFSIFKFNELNHIDLNISLYAFIIIGVGFLSCGYGGILSKRQGSIRVASIGISVSGICCLISPFIFTVSPCFFILIMIIWGAAVIMDSPQFSTLIASSAPKQLTGTALTVVNSIGFAISIVSIQLLNYMSEIIEPQYLFLLLVPGPVIGYFSVTSKNK